uniref:DUF2963 domain-containing protein n=1 Tax=Onion yellows phytoplasma TaxID=100379 RepID=C8KHN8_ONYPH|nr:DUF2963 domain-containing protein [Onion yellows phytoplasma]BAI39434.1 hypothetical protein [Onion yellows phytoplasma]BAI39440.1 hypothetical protein [Onion yellows phytoplasma]
MQTNNQKKLKNKIFIIWGLFITGVILVFLIILLLAMNKPQPKTDNQNQPTLTSKTNPQQEQEIYNEILNKIKNEVDELTNIKEIVYRPDDKTINYIKILDSQTKKEIKRIVYDGADDENITSIREFNPEGKLIKETFYLLDGKTISSIREFNPEGKQIKKTFYLLDGKTISSIGEFNPEGKQIKKTFYNPDGTVKQELIY